MDSRENEMMTRVGPGTPAGETLRRYWLPVSFSHEINADAPRLVRWLGEDLVLFRDEGGRVGLMEPNCPHRGTSLEYGWIEAGGLRCCYHGWVFNVGGRCIEQPGEPAGSGFKDKIQLKAYPITEVGGVVFAYMGPGKPPPFPRYDFLAREDGERTFAGYLRECNFLNQLDNCLDPVHATILHGREVNGTRENPERQESPEFEVLSDDLFASYVARRRPHGGTSGSFGSRSDPSPQALDDARDAPSIRHDDRQRSGRRCPNRPRSHQRRRSRHISFRCDSGLALPERKELQDERVRVVIINWHAPCYVGEMGSRIPGQRATVVNHENGRL